MAEIDAIRTNVNDLVAETIRLIDDVYKKGSAAWIFQIVEIRYNYR